MYTPKNSNLGLEPKTSGTTLGLHVFTSLDCATNRFRGIADIHFRMAGRQTATIECFHSRGQHLCQFIRAKERVCIRNEFNSQKIGLGHQHGRRFIVLGHQYGRRDVMWKHSITTSCSIRPYEILAFTTSTFPSFYSSYILAHFHNQTPRNLLN